MSSRLAFSEGSIEFLPHVPQAVRSFILSEVGLPGSTDIWALSNRLASAAQHIETLRYGSVPNPTGGLAEQLQEVEAYKADLERQIGDYRKLASSESMREAYAHLMIDFTHQSEWSRFLRSAVEAHKNYRLERERIAVSKMLQGKIVKQCEDLLALLTRFQGLTAQSVSTPLEFMQIPSLRWCLSPEWQEVWHDGADFARFWRFTPRPEERVPQKPAMTVDVIQRLIDAGLSFELAPTSNSVAAATSSNKGNPTTEYVRAFWSLLQTRFNSRLHKPSRFYKPVAITATVILDAPEVAVSYDDVRKAVSVQRGGQPPEDVRAQQSEKSSKHRARSRKEKN